MIDSGELDWKVVGIAVSDPLFDVLNDVEDIEKELPHTIAGIKEWFRWYKTPDSKPLNMFGYDEKAMGKEFACEVIQETHEAWKDLVAGKVDANGLWLK